MNERHGLSNTKTWKSWRSMRERCSNPNNPNWDNYGDRGITVCGRWNQSYLNFLSDMGERPEGTTLDRIDSNKGYEKKNCRWATIKTQNNNKRNNQIYKSRTVFEWADFLDLKVKTIKTRLHRGWPWEQALGFVKRRKK
mgnify:CR=1 FL=1